MLTTLADCFSLLFSHLQWIECMNQSGHIVERYLNVIYWNVFLAVSYFLSKPRLHIIFFSNIFSNSAAQWIIDLKVMNSKQVRVVAILTFTSISNLKILLWKKNMHNLKVLKWWLPFDYDVPISTLSLKVFIPAYMKILTKIMTMPLNNMKSKNFTRHYVPPLLNEHIIKKTDELSQNKVCVFF